METAKRMKMMLGIFDLSISTPDSTAVDEDGELELRTISVGDYDALFVSEKDPEVLEAERQEALSGEYFKWKHILLVNTFYSYRCCGYPR